MLILAINPGATSIKVAVFEDEKELVRSVVRFDTEVLDSFQTREEQNAYRMSAVTKFLEENGYNGEKLDCVVARGGALKQVKSGAYYINEKMVEDSLQAHGPHGLGIGVAYSMMHPLGKPCLIYDAVTADEWLPIAKVTGIKGIPKQAAQHTLNTRRVAIEVARQMGLPFNEADLIVAHIGGGSDTVCFRHGQIIDAIGYHDLGFTPERCGPIKFDTLMQLIKTMPEKDLRALQNGKGGLVSHFGTADIRKIQEMIEAGNEEAELVLHAMAYRIAQTIGACAASMQGRVDSIVITGGGAYSDLLYSWIEEAVRFIAPVKRFPGELELEALAQGALRVLRGEEEARVYI